MEARLHRPPKSVRAKSTGWICLPITECIPQVRKLRFSRAKHEQFREVPNVNVPLRVSSLTSNILLRRFIILAEALYLELLFVKGVTLVTLASPGFAPRIKTKSGFAMLTRFET
jgi:hypothetical protein